MSYVFIYRKTCIIASNFVRTIINIFIQVLFTSIISYLDRTFKEKQIQNKIFLLNWYHKMVPISNINTHSEKMAEKASSFFK